MTDKPKDNPWLLDKRAADPLNAILAAYPRRSPWRIARDYLDVVVIAAAALFLAFILGHAVGTGSDQPVCHSATEDSTMTDCEFHDGGWYQK